MSLVLLIGKRQSGKTSACRRLAGLASNRGLTACGIIAPAVYESQQCVGYDVVDLATGRSTRLATTDGPGVEQVGRFYFTSDGLALGKSALECALELSDRFVIVDEVGPLELAGGGWAGHVDRLACRQNLTVLTVRPSLARQVAERWNVAPESQCDLARGTDAAIDSVMRRVSREE